MEEILELVGNLDIRIKELLKGLGIDETSFLKKYADSSNSIGTFTWGGRRMIHDFVHWLMVTHKKLYNDLFSAYTRSNTEGEEEWVCMKITSVIKYNKEQM